MINPILKRILEASPEIIENGNKILQDKEIAKGVEKNMPKWIKNNPNYLAAYTILYLNRVEMEHFKPVVGYILKNEGSKFFGYGRKKLGEILKETLEKYYKGEIDLSMENVKVDRRLLANEELVLNICKERIKTHLKKSIVDGNKPHHRALRFLLHVMTNYGPVVKFEEEILESVVHPMAINEITKFLDLIAENKREETKDIVKIAIPIKYPHWEGYLTAVYDRRYGTVQFKIGTRTKPPEGFKNLINKFEEEKQYYM